MFRNLKLWNKLINISVQFLQKFRFVDICLAIMNILNKGRCARCSVSETKEIKVGTLIKGFYKVKIWRFCKKYEKYCRYCSNRCKAPPMGIQK